MQDIVGYFAIVVKDGWYELLMIFDGKHDLYKLLKENLVGNACLAGTSRLSIWRGVENALLWWMAYTVSNTPGTLSFVSWSLTVILHRQMEIYIPYTSLFSSWLVLPYFRPRLSSRPCLLRLTSINALKQWVSFAWLSPSSSYLHPHDHHKYPLLPWSVRPAIIHTFDSWPSAFLCIPTCTPYNPSLQQHPAISYSHHQKHYLFTSCPHLPLSLSPSPSTLSTSLDIIVLSSPSSAPLLLFSSFAVLLLAFVTSSNRDHNASTLPNSFPTAITPSRERFSLLMFWRTCSKDCAECQRKFFVWWVGREE